MVQHRRGGGYDPIRRSSVQRWHDARLRELDEQETNQRYEEEQRAVAARAARSKTVGQTAEPVPAQPVTWSPDSPQMVGLARAEQAVATLAAQTQESGVGWAAGVYDIGGQVMLVATSNEGLGYIPRGVLWDPKVKLVFDPAVPLPDAMSWQGLQDPARIVAGWFLRLQASRRGGWLSAVASTDPIGDKVAELLTERGAAMAERVPAGRKPQSGVHRVETVLPGVLDQARSMHPWQRWNTAVALLRDAAALAEVSKTYPQVRGIMEDWVVGRADQGQVPFAEQSVLRLARLAQERRVAEERLGPVSGAQMDRATALPAGGVDAWAIPFRAARVCVMLAVMLPARAEGQDLSAEDLADVVYEHHNVAEDMDATRRLLAQSPVSQAQQGRGAQ